MLVHDIEYLTSEKNTNNFTTCYCL